MVKKDLVAAGKFDEITKLTRQAVEKMLGFEVRHVGVNLASEAEAEELADKFSDMFGFEKKNYFEAEAGAEKAPKVEF